VIHDGMPYDTIQSQGQDQGHGGLTPKVTKPADFKVYLLHVIKRLMVSYDTRRHYLNFNLTI